MVSGAVRLYQDVRRRIVRLECLLCIAGILCIIYIDFTPQPMLQRLHSKRFPAIQSPTRQISVFWKIGIALAQALMWADSS